MAEHDPNPTAPQTPPGDAPATPQPEGAPAAPHAPAKPRRRIGPIIGTVLVRVYTLALALVIAVVCFSAIFYLFKFVFTPAKLPASMTQWQGHLEPDALRQANVPGITGDAGRAPMSHYHKVDRWFQSDPQNGCTTSGCHSPLPHEQKSKIAAFANLHVTFMDCMVCHDKSATAPGRINAHWISIQDYRQQDIPAVLRLMAVLDQVKPDAASAQAAHGNIVALLKDVIKAVGTDPVLNDLIIQIDSTVPNSPLWKKSVQRLSLEIPRHARGEYGAKIARAGAVRDAKSLASASQAILAEPKGSARHKELNTVLHQDVLAEPSACAVCHSKEPSAMLDFQAMGYPAGRAKSLRELPLAGMVQQIRQGEVFQLPKLLEAGDGR